MTYLMRKKNSGFAVLSMIMLVVVLIAVVAGVVAASRSTPSSANDQNAKTLGASIIEQGNWLKSGVDMMTAKGSDIANVTFDSAVTTGLFNGATGGTETQKPPTDALAIASTGTWVYAKPANGVAITGVGTGASSYAVLLTGVKDSVCKQVNQLLRGYAASGAIPVSAAAPAITASLTTAPYDLTTATMTGVVDGAGAAVTTLTGATVCVKPISGTDNNVFVNVIKPL